MSAVRCDVFIVCIGAPGRQPHPHARAAQAIQTVLE